jgi:hypothetical protein
MIRRPKIALANGMRRGWASGQALVDFPLAALLAVTFTVSMVFCGVAVYSYNFVSQAARDATRYASVNGANSLNPVDASAVQDYVRKEATGLNKGNITVTTTWSPDNKPGSVVKVAVTYNFQPFYPMSGSTIALSSSSQMVISR